MDEVPTPMPNVAHLVLAQGMLVLDDVSVGEDIENDKLEGVNEVQGRSQDGENS